jgi:hypothetical protein
VYVKHETINTILGVAAVLLALHLTATAVLCYMVGALVAMALSNAEGGG